MANDFIQKWFQEPGISEFFVFAEPPAGDIAIPRQQMLVLPEDVLGDFAEDLLELPPDSVIGEQMEELRAGIQAYLQFQDLLDVPLDRPCSPILGPEALSF